MDLLGTRNNAFFPSTQVQNTLWETHTQVRHVEIKISALLVTKTNIRERGVGLLASGLLLRHLIHQLIRKGLTQSQFPVLLDYCRCWNVWVL